MVAGPVARSLAGRLPENVVAAVVELMTGDLVLAPRRVGKPLRGDLAGQWSARRGTYRILYEVDDEAMTVTVTAVEHRRDAYRSR